MITFDLGLIPFSQKGSFLIITSRNSSYSPRLLYKTCSGRIHSTNDLPFPSDEFFELSLVKDGMDVPYTWQAFPHRLELNGTANEQVVLTFGDPNTLLFQAKNVGLRLMPCKVFPVQYSPVANEIYLVDWLARGIHMFRADDTATVTATVTPIVTGIEKHWGEFPCTITFTPKPDISIFGGAIRFSRFESFWTERLPDFDKVLITQESVVNQWMAKLPKIPEKYHSQAELAWFLLWNDQVPGEGALLRPTIYMSKFWMNGIWAWDNLFNAMAVVKADAQLAWDQLLLFFDHQDPNGMVPDMITDLEPIYGFTKPPLHGWVIRKLVDKLGLKKSLPYLKSIYAPLTALTDWWYVHRDFDHDGLPQYFHGNDSGWDNSTIFDQGFSVEGSDLGAYLVLQCECLAFIAGALGRENDSLRCKSRAEDQLAVLLSQSVKDDHFYSPLSTTHEVAESQSLINYLPLILGKRLPKRIRTALIADLHPGGPFLTRYGLASESPSSIKYMSDGYWRGPIWGASTYIIFDGLLASGETDLARLIAERFCNMCVQEPGFWENYDALTGKGLRCPGYSWTASIFLLLTEWLGKSSKGK